MKHVIKALIVSVLMVGVVSMLPAETKSNTTNAQQPAFDHSKCQYPDRWTNPVNGCDNSDPAVPECIKDFSTEAGEKACIDAFVAEHAEPTPTEPVKWEGK